MQTNGQQGVLPDSVVQHHCETRKLIRTYIQNRIVAVQSVLAQTEDFST